MGASDGNENRKQTFRESRRTRQTGILFIQHENLSLKGWSATYGSLLMEGQDNLLWFMASASPSLSGFMSSTCFQLSSIEPSLHWGGVKNFESSLEPLGVSDRDEWPTRSFWRVEKDSLIADMASKNRVQEASAAGIGRSISFIKRNRGS